MAWWWRDRPGAKQKGRKKRKMLEGRERGSEGEREKRGRASSEKRKRKKGRPEGGWGCRTREAKRDEQYVGPW